MLKRDGCTSAEVRNLDRAQRESDAVARPDADFSPESRDEAIPFFGLSISKLVVVLGLAGAVAGCAAGFNNEEQLAEQLSITEGASHDFGTSTVGNKSEKAINFVNRSRFDIYLLDLTPEKAVISADFKVTGGTCTTVTSLSPGSECSLSLVFSPTANGDKMGSLPIGFRDDFNSETITLQLSGVAQNPGLISISEGSSFDFGEKVLATESTKIFTLTNVGQAPLKFRTLSSSSVSLSNPLKLSATGATCQSGSTLAISNTCLLPVSFAPTKKGSTQQVLTVGYYNDTETTDATITLIGVGASAASLSLSGLDPLSFGDVAIGASGTYAVTLTHLGGVKALLGSTAASSLGVRAPFGLLGSTCTSTLDFAAGSSCIISLSYTPTAIGESRQTITLGYHDGIAETSLTRALTGRGAGEASLVISPSGTYQFGTATAGTTVSKTFTVTNQGGTSTQLGTLTGTALGSSAPFSLSGGSCVTGMTLGPTTGSCTIIVDFSPTAAVTSTQNLSFTYANGTVQFAVRGTGQLLGNLELTDTPNYNYGANTLTTTSTRTLTLSNTGTLDVTLGSVNTSANLNLSAPFSRNGGNCSNGQTLAAGSGTCTIVVEYTPTAAVVSTATLSVSYNNGVAQTYETIGLGGVGRSRASLSFSPSSYNHGNKIVSTQNSSTFTVTNSGGSTATLGTVSTAGLGLASPFAYTSGTCSSSGTLTSGSTCTVVVRYQPTAAVASTQGFTLSASDAAGAITSATATISGTGVNGAALTFSDGSSYDFGSLTIDGTSSRTITVTNSGTSNGTLGSVNSSSDLGLSAPFTRTGGTCANSAVLAAGGGTCTIIVSYSPTAAVSSSQTLTLNYDNSAGMTTALISFGGTGLSHANLALTPSATFNFGSKTIGSSSTQIFTVTNAGQTAAALGTISSGGLGLAAPYTHTGGSCVTAGSLSPSATCTLSIAFSPAAQTNSQTSLSLGYTDQGGYSLPATQHGITGTGISAASIAITPAGTFSFGSKTIGVSTTQVFTLTNSGQSSATFGTIDTSNLNLGAPMVLAASSCASSGQLASGSSCSLSITYTPSAGVTSNLTLSVSYQDGATTQAATKALDGTGITAAVLAISDGTTYDYGSKTITTSTSKIFTINNTGQSPAILGTLNSANLNLSSPFAYATSTCTSTLTAGGSCTITADYVPTTAVTSNGTLSLAFYDGVSNTSSTRSLKGTGLTRAALALTPTSPSDFGNVTIGGTSNRSVTITNSGQSDATLGTLSTAGFALAGTDYSYSGGGCVTGGTLSASSTCIVTFAFAPTAQGASTRTITLGYSDAAGTLADQTYSIQGTGASPAALSLSPIGSYDFGSRTVGTTSTYVFTLTNNGQTSATLGTLSTAGLNLGAPFTHNGGTSTCLTGAALGGGSTCLVAIDYSPVASVGSNATLSISYSNGVTLVDTTKGLSGTGISPASLAVTPCGSFNFGSATVGNTSTQAFTITNSGSTAATLGTISTGGLNLAAPFTFSSGTCATSGTIAASSSCVITLSFAPSSAVNSNATLSVSYNDGVTSQYTSKSLGGLGITPATLAVTPSGSFNFGSVSIGNTSTQALTITNSGSTDATLGTISTGGLNLAAPFTFSSGTCASSGTVAASSSCVITLSFTPSSAVNSNATLSVSYNDGVTSQYTSKSLGGLGITPGSLVITPSGSFNFGSVTVGNTSIQAFTITNSGATDATLGTISTGGLNLAAPFTFSSGTCASSGTVAASSSCVITLSFAPSSAVNSNATLSVSYNDGVTSQYTSKSLGGLGITPATLAVTPSGSFNFGSVTVGNTSTQAFTITNSGSTDATLGTISTGGLNLAAPFTFSSGTCASSGTVAASSSCVITLSFAPSSAVNSNATLSVSYNDGVTSQYTSKSLGGLGITPATLAVTPSGSFNFGSQTVGLTTTQAFTITNSGSTAATLGTISTGGLNLAAPFTFSSGTCATSGTVAASSSCVITLSFAPSSAVNSNATLSVSYNDGVTSQYTSKSLGGLGITAATLAVTPSGSFNLGSVTVGNTSLQAFTITNSGSTDATLGTISTGGLNLAAPFTFSSGTCASSGTVAASSSCVITLSFAPSTAVNSNATLSVSYNDGVTSQYTSKSLGGLGITPATLAVTPSGSFNFGSVTVGNTSLQAFTITNSGSTDATLGTISTGGLNLAAPFTFSSGTCATSGTVAASSSCVITLSFAPSSAVNSNATLSVSYNDGVTSQYTSKSLGGLGLTPATLTISDGPTHNFGSATTGTTVQKIFTINNTGQSTASLGTLNSANLNLSSPYAYNSTTCGATVAAGANCTITADFSPVAAGASNATLSLSYNDGAAAAYSERFLTGTGLSAAVLAITPSGSFNFGSVTVGNTSLQAFTITNSGSTDATLGTISTGGLNLAAPFTFSSGTCASSGTVAASSSCVITLSFAPSSAVNSNATLSVSYNDGVTSQYASKSLGGLGITPATLAVTPSGSFNFGSQTVGLSTTQAFTITNSGSTAATLGTISTGGLNLAAPFTFSSGTCASSGTVAASSSCVITLNFAPSSAVNSNATLSVSYNDGVTSQYTSKSLGGLGITPATLAVTPSGSFNFGSQTVGLSTTQAFTITNSGSTDATLGTISTGGLNLAAPFTFSSGTCASSGTVAASSSCVITLSFAPSSAVNSNATLSVSYNDGVTSQYTSKSLGGLGITPATLAVTPSGSFNFGSQTVGLSTTQAFTITNSGSTAATLGTISTGGLNLAAPFTFSSGTCSTSGTVAASSSCVITLSFAPSSAVNSNATLSVSYNDGVTSQYTSKSLGGLGLTAATLAVTPSGSFNFGSVTVGNTSTQAFTITNSGSTDATLGTISTGGMNLAAPFTFSSGTCASSGTVAASSSCVITLSFAPSSAVNSNATLSVSYNDGVTSQYASKSLGGLGITPATLAVTPSGSFNFGSVTVGNTSLQAFTITNSGSTAATLGTISTGGLNLAAPFTFSSGTCATSGTVAASSSCVITLSFAPSSAVNSNATLSVSYNDGVTSQYTSKTLGGLGITPATLAVTPSGSFNFGSQTVGLSTTQAFTITNSGSTAATLGTISTGGLNLAAPFTFSSGTCATSGTVAASSSCVITLSFAPSSAVNSNATLSVSYNDGVTSQYTSKSLGGLGLTPATLTVSDGPTYDYGSQTLTTVTSKIFTINNTGQTAASLGTLNSANLNLSAPFTYNSTTCGASVAAAGSCTITADYTPSAAVTSTGIFSLSYNDGVATTNSTRPIKGTGLSRATLAVTPTSTYNFGNVTVGNTSTQIFTVTNSGQSTATLGTVSQAGFGLSGTDYAFTGGSCSTSGTVAASSTCIVTLTYSPSTAGASSRTITVSYSDAGGSRPDTTHSLAGTGLSVASLTLTPANAFDFGNKTITTVTTQTFTLTNSGQTAATLGTISTAGLNLSSTVFSLSGGTCATSGTVSASGGSCTVAIDYVPTSAVNSTATLSVSFNNGASAGQNTLKSIQGTGLSRASLALAPASTFNFGNVTVGNTSLQAFTLTNSGQSVATLGTVSHSGFGFSGSQVTYTGGSCVTSGSVAASGTCTLTLGFVPTGAGASSRTLTLSYSDSAGSLTALQHSVQGTGLTPASIALTPSGAFGFGSKTLTTTTTQIFTLTNSGQTAATLGTISTAGLNLAAPFTHNGGSSTCASSGSLAASGTCTVAVDYVPSAAVTSNATLSVSYNDGVTSQNSTKAISGTGLARASLAYSPSGTYDLGSKTVTTTSEAIVTVTNSGGSNAVLGTVTTAAFGLTGTDYSLSSATCTTGGTLAPASTCVLTVAWTPTGSGVATRTITLSYSDAAGALTGITKTYTGTGLTAASLALTPAGAFDYGNVDENTTATQIFTLTNSGESAATLGTIDDTGLQISGSAFAFPGGSCATSGSVAGSGGTCTMTIAFTPTSAGAFNKTMKVFYDDGTGTTNLTKDLSGTGVSAATASLTITPLAYNFGSVYGNSNSSVQTFTFTNTSPVVAATSCTAPTITGSSGKITITSDGCGTANLAASSSCVVSVRAQSPAFGSSYSGTLSRSCSGTSTQTIENGLRVKGVYSTAVRQVVAGDTHTCAVLMDGTVKCWGHNNYGQLGLGNATDRGGTSNSMATLATVNIGTGVTAVDIKSAANHNCLLLDTGAVKCWGSGTNGVLGKNSSTTIGTISSTEIATMAVIDIGASRLARAIEVGGTNTCVIRDDGELKCWGAAYGLGTGDTTNQGDGAGEMASLKTVTIMNNDARRRAIQVSQSSYNGNACSVNDDGSIACWGSGINAVLGQGNANNSYTPVSIADYGGYSKALMVKVGNGFACAIDPNGGATCWGNCAGYALGNGCPTNTMLGDASGEMTTLSGPVYSRVKDIDLSSQKGCALGLDGIIQCWGTGAHALGVGSLSSMQSATESSLGSNRARSISFKRDHMCSIFGDGGLRCWGDGTYGKLGRENTTSYGGNNSTELTTMLPVNLGVKIGPIDVAVGVYSTCVVLNDGTVKCWGADTYGELGYGTGAVRGTNPGDMESLPDVNLGTGKYAVAIASGVQHTCATLVDGDVKCWGYNGYGELGQNHTGSIGASSSEEIASLAAVNMTGTYSRKLTSGGYHNCSVTEYSNIYCWGANDSGQLGVDDVVSRGTDTITMNWWQVTTSDFATFKDVAVGYAHSCGTSIQGQVYCWGSGASGQLGYDNTLAYGSDTVGNGLAVSSSGGPVTMISGTIKIVAGYAHTCALESTGSVKCWGYGAYGQLGNDSTSYVGSSTNSMYYGLIAVNLGTGNNAIDIAAGAYHTCAILGDRTVKCWGYNGNGQLGYNNTTDKGGTAGDMASLGTVNFGTGLKALKIFSSAYANHTCVITTNGLLKCWGYNGYGQLGQDSTTEWGSGGFVPDLSTMPAVPLR